MAKPKDKITLWDLYLKNIVSQPIESKKDREEVEQARQKSVELRQAGYRLSTEI